MNWYVSSLNKVQHRLILILLKQKVCTESRWLRGFPVGSVVKNLPANVGDTGSIRKLGKSLGGRNGNPLQYSCLENPMDRRAVESIGFQTVRHNGAQMHITDLHCGVCFRCTAKWFRNTYISRFFILISYYKILSPVTIQ